MCHFIYMYHGRADEPPNETPALPSNPSFSQLCWDLDAVLLCSLALNNISSHI